MTRLLTVLFSVAVLTVGVGAQTSEVPEGIVYSPPSEAQIKAAQATVSKMIAKDAPEKELQMIFRGERLVCAPFAWSLVARENEMKAIKEGTSYFKVRLKKGEVEALGVFEGKTLTKQQDMIAFWRALVRKLDLSSAFTVRKLTANELRQYWAMITFDIVDPVVVAENKKHKILLQFTGPDSSLLWVDDITGPGLPVGQEDAEQAPAAPPATGSESKAK
jgi:hypothetical protein